MLNSTESMRKNIHQGQEANVLKGTNNSWHLWDQYSCNLHRTIRLNKSKGSRELPHKATVQITFIFIGQTRLVFGKCVGTCVTKHSNAFRTFLNWLKNSKRVWHEPKLHISRLPLFANFDL